MITLAVEVITIVTGLGPQLNVMMPPAATSRTTAADVQLAGVPSPITWFGMRGVDRAAGGRHVEVPVGVAEVGHDRTVRAGDGPE